MNFANDVGAVSESKSLLPFSKTEKSLKRFAPIIGFGELVTLNHRSHSSIEDEDARG
jgi:hypothetical protein